MKSLSEIFREIFRERKKKEIEIGDEAKESQSEKANIQRTWDRLWKGRQ